MIREFVSVAVVQSKAVLFSWLKNSGVHFF